MPAHQAERGRRGGQLADRHRHHRDRRHREIKRGGDNKREHHRAREVAMRYPGFFDNVGEILETDKGKESEQGGIGNAGKHGAIERRHGYCRRYRNAGLETRNDDDHEPAHFDQREQAGEQNRFKNSPAGDKTKRSQHQHNDDAARPNDELLI
jgi:hypothetical protein